VVMRQLVAAPSLRKAANGLLDVANVTNIGDEKAEDGVTFTPFGCQAVFAHVPTCPAEDKAPFYDCPPPVAATSYLLEVGLSWSLVDMGANPKAILTEAFEVATSPVLERLVSSGIADVAGGSPIVLPPGAGAVGTGGIRGRIQGSAVAPPTLATALDVGGTPANSSQAIGMVETKLLDTSDHTGGGGTLLMSPFAAATAGEGLTYDGDKLITRATRSPVVVGNISPLKTVYAVLGEIDVYLGEVQVLEAYERSKNEWVGRAERRAIAVWNTCGVYSAAFT
jgi:hypothetical protein